MGRHKKNKGESKHHLQEYSKISTDSDNENTNNLEDDKTGEFSDDILVKRPHVNDDSDHEDEEKPKKAKKKNNLPAAVSTDKKNKMSIRRMKREKYAMRVALEKASAKDQLKTQCLNYLSQWKHDRQNWKFMKAKQVWLHKNKFSTDLIPDSSWPLLIEYFESAKGNIKNLLLSDANKIIKQMDEWTESQVNDAECEKDELENTDIQKPNETVYNRARNLIQCLHE